MVLVKDLVIFPRFYLDKIGSKNVFHNILKRKNVFLDYNKNNYFKTEKRVNPRFW